MSMVILASGSRARARMLEAAGLEFRTEPAEIDEAELKRAGWAADRTPEDCALILAEAKARSVSRRYPGTLVVGAD
jgi:septum formation protein